MVAAELVDELPELAPRCAVCRKRHAPGLACWRGRYATRITRLVLDVQGDVCWLCGRRGADSADHVTPRAQWGTDGLDNLRPAHVSPCNSRRGRDRPFEPEPEPRPRGVGLSARWRP